MSLVVNQSHGHYCFGWVVLRDEFVQFDLQILVRMIRKHLIC